MTTTGRPYTTTDSGIPAASDGCSLRVVAGGPILSAGVTEPVLGCVLDRGRGVDAQLGARVAESLGK